MLKDKKILILFAAAAIAVLLAAGCGWTSGPTFPEGTYNPANADPATVVQNWLESMQFRETTNDQGQVQRLPENGRDFDLWLMVSDPQWLTDPTSGAVATPEDIENYRTQWQADNWQVEFRDVQMRELPGTTGSEATIELYSGAVRYIGQQFFHTNEYKQDSFSDKKAHVFLRYYKSDENDPLRNVPQLADRAVSRWVVTGGLDLGEKESFPQ